MMLNPLLIFYPIYRFLFQHHVVIPLFTLLICFSCLSSVSHAEKIVGVFESNQMVANYSSAERKKAVRKGLEEVLIRYSGSRDILHEGSVSSILQNPEALLSSFKYFSYGQPEQKNSAQDTNNGQNTQATKSRGRQGIGLNFNGQMIREHLVRARLPIWSPNRPRLVVWWAVDNQKQRTIASEQTDIQLVNSLALHAKRRGIPLVLPKMDKQDLHSVDINDVWTLDYDRLQVVSRRYNPGVLLLARSTHTLSGKWYAQWGLVSDGRLKTGTIEAKSEHALVSQVIDQISENLAKEYSVVVRAEPISDAQMQIVIHNISDLKDYAQVSEYLEKLMLVKYLGLSRVEQGKLIFDLELHGELTQFRKEIGLDHRFSAISTPSYSLGPPAGEGSTETLMIEADPINRIEYRWIGRK